MTSVTDVAEVTGSSGTGRSASRGGCDPRDAEVRAFRKQLAEMQCRQPWSRKRGTGPFKRGL